MVLRERKGCWREGRTVINKRGGREGKERKASYFLCVFCLSLQQRPLSAGFCFTGFEEEKVIMGRKEGRL